MIQHELNGKKIKFNGKIWEVRATYRPRKIWHLIMQVDKPGNVVRLSGRADFEVL